MERGHEFTVKLAGEGAYVVKLEIGDIGDPARLGAGSQGQAGLPGRTRQADRHHAGRHHRRKLNGRPAAGGLLGRMVRAVPDGDAGAGRATSAASRPC
jgi:hypothetical protein